MHSLPQHLGTKRISTMCLRWTKLGMTTAQLRVLWGIGAVAKISYLSTRPRGTTSSVEMASASMGWRSLSKSILCHHLLRPPRPMSLPRKIPPLQQFRDLDFRPWRCLWHWSCLDRREFNIDDHVLKLQ